MNEAAHFKTQKLSELFYFDSRNVKKKMNPDA